MGMPRPSLAHLLGVIALIAIGLAALKEPSEFRLGIVATLAAEVFLLAVFAAARGRGPRAFWTGFVVAGAGYFALCLTTWSSTPPPGPELATTRFLDQMTVTIRPRLPFKAEGRDKDGNPCVSIVMHDRLGMTETQLAPQRMINSYRSYLAELTGEWNNHAMGIMFTTGDLTDYRKVGHTLIGLALAVVGGGLFAALAWSWRVVGRRAGSVETTAVSVTR